MTLKDPRGIGLARYPDAQIGIVAEYTWHDAEGCAERRRFARSLDPGETVADLLRWADRRGGQLDHLDLLEITIDCAPAKTGGAA